MNGTKIYNDQMYIWIDPYTGSATAHKESKGGNRYNSQNCYTYATGLRSSSSLNPGDISGKAFNIRDVYSVADAVVADLEYSGYGGRILGTEQGGISGGINADEYRIAVSVGSGKVYGQDIEDYHFMVENSDGTWSEKHGPGGNAIKHDLYETPQSLAWSCGDNNNFYTSDIVYIAVRKQGN